MRDRLLASKAEFDHFLSKSNNAKDAEKRATDRLHASDSWTTQAVLLFRVMHVYVATSSYFNHASILGCTRII